MLAICANENCLVQSPQAAAACRKQLQQQETQPAWQPEGQLLPEYSMFPELHRDSHQQLRGYPEAQPDALRAAEVCLRWLQINLAAMPRCQALASHLSTVLAVQPHAEVDAAQPGHLTCWMHGHSFATVQARPSQRPSQGTVQPISLLSDSDEDELVPLPSLQATAAQPSRGVSHILRPAAGACSMPGQSRVQRRACTRYSNCSALLCAS